jgi:N6-L-threonylcarbamoyladenine synthase
MSRILAIETSCDETSVALLDQTTVLALVTASQIKDHEAFGGVFPELASRLHTEKITFIIEQALQQAQLSFSDIDAFAATAGPGLLGSLHIGVMAAKTLAMIYDKPYIPVHHLAAHLEAAAFTQPLAYPLLGLLVSGGHTYLIHMDEPLSYRIIGETRDDAVGEAFDKIARMMNLPYPGGPEIDRLAQLGTHAYTLPKPLPDGFDFSFSGVKTHVQTLIQQHEQKKIPIQQENLAFDVQTTLLDSLFDKTIRAFATFPYRMLVIAGGVASNKGLRNRFGQWARQENIHLVIPPPWACTDNGAMIGILASRLHDRHIHAPLDHKVDPNWSLRDLKYKV